VLATIGLYQDAVIKNDIDGEKTQAHIFEVSRVVSQWCLLYIQLMTEGHRHSTRPLSPCRRNLLLLHLSLRMQTTSFPFR
jgi:hypothetical protein